MATPSIEMYPESRMANLLLSQRPTDGTADLTFSRASKATEINSDGYIAEVVANMPRFEYGDGVTCPSLLLEPASTNLITYPVTFPNTYWTKSGSSIEGDASTGVEEVTNGSFESGLNGSLIGGDETSAWTLNTSSPISGSQDGKLVVSVAGTNNSRPLVDGWSGISITDDTLYLIQFDYKVNSGTCVLNQINVGGGLLTVNVTLTGSGTFSRYFVSTAVSASFGSLYFNGTNTFDVQIDSVSIKDAIGFASPHVDYPTGAFKLVESATTSAHFINTPSEVSINGTATSSVYAKKGERSAIKLSTNGIISSGSYANFDLLNGVVSASANCTATIVLIGEYYKCTFTYPSNGGSAPQVYLVLLTDETDATFQSYLGDGTSGVYIFGAQLEQQSSATSFIYDGTEGSATIRYQDLSYIPSSVTTWDFTSEDFTFVFDINFKDISNSPVIYCKGLNNTDGWYIEIASTGSVVVYSNQAAANQQTLTATGAFVIDTQTKIVVTRSGASVKIYKDGTDITLTSGTHINPVSASARNMYFGNYNTIALPVNGDTKEHQVYTTELTATQVAAL